jgi:pimeloyl-ACP methyl ester carboxylesterase
MTNGKAPVVFIHGLWLHASSWTPWLDLFTEAGYPATAPGWPGIPDTVPEARANPDSIADHGSAATDLEEFDRGHSLVIDGGWHAVASECLAWLEKQGL